ncbi:MAG: HAD family hydrolase, partial [Planctomycetota bacterium]
HPFGELRLSASMRTRNYDAVLFDLDGTLLDEDGRIRERSRQALRELRERDVMVLLATGRSVISTKPVLEDLGLDTPAVTFNGAVVWDPARGRAIEEQVLGTETFRRSLAFAEERDLLCVVMRTDLKVGMAPRTEGEELGLRYLSELRTVERHELDVEYPIRVTFYEESGRPSAELCAEVEAAIARPVYLTHFPLNHLPNHRSSTLQVVDVHPPCRGKAEALRVLDEHYSIPAERVMAFGDASNDVPMLLGAGLGVAMGDGMASAQEAADVIIGSNRTDAIADFLTAEFGL